MKKRVLSFILAAVILSLAIPFAALPALAEEANVISETWDGGASIILNSHPSTDTPNDARNDNYAAIHTFYIWIDGETGRTLIDYNDADEDGTRFEDEFLTDDDYAIISPALIEGGFVDPNATYEEQIAQYRDNYIAEAGRIIYTGGWSIGNFVDAFEVIDRRAMFTANQNILNIRRKAGGNQEEVVFNRPIAFTYASTATSTQPYTDKYFDIALEPTFPRPGEDGRLYFEEVKYLIPEDDDGSASDESSEPNVGVWDWSANSAGVIQFALGTLPNGDEVLGVRPANGGSNGSAYTYTVPNDVYGIANISVDKFNILPNQSESGTSVYFALAVNNEIVWPAGATKGVTSTYKELSSSTRKALNTELAALDIQVKPGDQVSLVIARTQAITVDIRPTIEIEKRCVVEYKDNNGNVMMTEMVTPGSARPVEPQACTAGFKVNGVAVSELPATVTENLFIEYMGDPRADEITVESASISVSSDFEVNLYVRADSYATRVAADTDAGEYWGVLQDDGTYKITVPGVAAKDMSQVQELWFFQEFAGGNEGSNNNAYEVCPIDLLAKYGEWEDTPEMLALGQAAYQYAKAADAYFNGGELDADIKTALATYDSAIATLSKEVAVDTSEDYCINAVSLVLKDQVAFKISVGLSDLDILPSEVLDFGYRMASTSKSYKGEACFSYRQGWEFDGEPLYAVAVLHGLTPANFDTEWNITILNESGKPASGKTTYSVNAYIARTFEGGEGEADDLLRALYAFGVAADAVAEA